MDIWIYTLDSSHSFAQKLSPLLRGSLVLELLIEVVTGVGARHVVAVPVSS